MSLRTAGVPVSQAEYHYSRPLKAICWLLHDCSRSWYSNVRLSSSSHAVPSYRYVLSWVTAWLPRISSSFLVYLYLSSAYSKCIISSHVNICILFLLELKA
jgi:hypothetical protein